MAVRPKDLNENSQTLHCGECVVDYPALPELYEWMFDSDLIVCAACGAELVVVEKVMADS